MTVKGVYLTAANVEEVKAGTILATVDRSKFKWWFRLVLEVQPTRFIARDCNMKGIPYGGTCRMSKWQVRGRGIFDPVEQTVKLFRPLVREEVMPNVREKTTDQAGAAEG